MHPDSDEDTPDARASERPFYQRGARFAAVNSTGFLEAEAAANRTPPRRDPTERSRGTGTPQSPVSPSGHRLGCLSRAERALLREWAETVELQETEVRLRRYLCRALEGARAEMPSTNASPPAAERASTDLQVEEVVSADDSDDEWHLVAPDSGWQMVASSAPTTTAPRSAAMAYAAQSEGASSRQRRRPRHRRPAPPARRPLDEVHRPSLAAERAEEPPCVLPPTASPLLRAMQRACVAFYGMESAHIKSPVGAVNIDERAVAATLPQAARHTDAKRAAQAVRSLDALTKLSVQRGLTEAFAASARPRRRLQM